VLNGKADFFSIKIALTPKIWQKKTPILTMKKEKPNAEAQLLDLLKKVLPKATHDPELAGQIYDAVASELRAKNRAVSFEKFCSKLALPDLDAKSIDDVKLQLSESFGDGDITIKPNKKEQSLAVEVLLPDGNQFRSEIKVNPNANVETSDEQEVVLKLIPFPVAMPGDPELAWVLARRENITAEEGAILLSKLEEDFWLSKQGQKLIGDRVERSFPEFIARVPSGMLSEAGLKRHYKEPEPIKVLHPQAPKPKKKADTE
jgi:hypothetical protein